MSYVYAWLCDSVPFYFGFSENKDGQYKRSKRIANGKPCSSPAENRYKELRKCGRMVDIKIIMDDLTIEEALLLESALIMKFRSKLKNVACMDLRLNETKETDILSVANDLIVKIRNGTIISSDKTKMYDRPRLLYITTEEGYDIIGYHTFTERYGMTIEKFLKTETPKHYKISKIEFDFADGRKELNF